ncbi:hypothetical protein H4Q26_015797 [Puccinia striiformis f. sp. tritici PST-130]|nr:hypothetical protein H4Q26_015797 [Puccinia striiformis f. sp. tritici PST-130]
MDNQLLEKLLFIGDVSPPIREDAKYIVVAVAAATVTSASNGSRRSSYFLARVENNLNLALKALHSARQLEMGDVISTQLKSFSKVP